MRNCVPGPELLDKCYGAAMGKHQFAGDDEAEAGAAGARRPAESGKQVLFCLTWHSRPVVVDDDADDVTGPLSSNGQMSRHGICRIRLKGLNGVATEIVDHTEQLLGIRVDGQIAGHAVMKLDAAFRLKRQNIAHIPNQKA